MDSSWDNLDLDGAAIQKTRDENEKKAREIAGHFYRCFSTDDGQYVLERLKEVTIDRPVLNANSTQFGAGMREGQNMIVRQILDQMKIAEEQ